MKNFVYDVSTKIYFGPDQLGHLKEEVSRFGKKVMLTYGGGSIKRSGLYDSILKELDGMEVYEFGGIESNPRNTTVNKGASLCKEEGIDVILAVGGGSVIDASKVMAAARYYEGDCWDFISRKAVIEKALPIVSILTMAATGSEMDKTAVITNEELHKKASVSDKLIEPAISFLDPTLTFSVSEYQTACGSADIFSHTCETYFSRDEGMLFLDTVMEGLMRTVIQCAPVAMKTPDDYDARANLMWASSWAINGFVRADKPHKWQCHALGHGLSAFYDMTHGLSLAIVTPRWMRKVLNEKTAHRFYEYAVYVWGVSGEEEEMTAALKGIEKTEEFLYKTLGLAGSLGELGIGSEHFEEMADDLVKDGPLSGYVDLSKEDILEIYQNCL